MLFDYESWGTIYKLNLSSVLRLISQLNYQMNKSNLKIKIRITFFKKKKKKNLFKSIFLTPNLKIYIGKNIDILFAFTF